MRIYIDNGTTTETLAQSYSAALDTPVLQGDIAFDDEIAAQPLRRMRAESAPSVPRGNETITGSFTAARTLTDYQAALSFAYAHPASVIRSGTLVIEIDTGTYTSIESVVITRVSVRTQGCRALVTYQFQGGSSTYTAAP